MKSPTNSNLKQVDLAVVGGGLAGCAMVWQAIRRGLSVAMIDLQSNISSSRVAAGLVTPITGSRLALSWRYPEYFQAADELYRFAELKLQASFWSVAPALRIFSSDSERDLFEDRWAKPEFLEPNPSIHVQRVSQGQHPNLAAPHGGFLMSPAARLATEVYLDSTRRMLDAQGLLYESLLDLDQDLVLSEHAIRFPSLNLCAQRVCLAQGVAARSNRWFGSLALHPARGDILKIASKSPSIEHVVHREGWIVPLGAQEFLLGATYARGAQDCQIDSQVGISAREELLRRWYAFFHSPAPSIEIIQQRAAVRPASYDRHPLIGSHGEHSNLFCINGLGSKGSLMAPRLAQLLLDHVEFGSPIDKALHFDRRRA